MNSEKTTTEAFYISIIIKHFIFTNKYQLRSFNNFKNISKNLLNAICEMRYENLKQICSELYCKVNCIMKLSGERNHNHIKYI